jgi:hypothetical protein
MTPAQIKRRATTINNNIKKWNDALRMLQVTCTHPTATKKYGANTGNYDPSADSYWIDYTCPDCGKRWMTEQ